MFDLKVINSVLEQLEEERGIPREKIIEAIESALSTAYKKEYGKRGQIVRANFDISTGTTSFDQVKIVVDETKVRIEEDEDVAEGAAKDKTKSTTPDEDDERPRYNPEHHIFLEDARLIKKDVALDDEMVFPLEDKDDYGRIAAQTAKQVIIQKIREAEKVSIMTEYGEREGEIVTGTVQRVERGNMFIDLTRATGILSYDEQIPGEHYKQGERIRAYLYRVEETPRGLFLRLSRSHPQFLKELFRLEAPEIANETVEIKAIAREAGSRSKVAVETHDDHIDPVGSLVGQRGVRVSTVKSELGGEQIDIIEWSDDVAKFIEEALSPAKIISVTLNEDAHTATILVDEDQQSLAIGKGGQNVRLAAKLTGWKIDIQSAGGSKEEKEETNVEVEDNPSASSGQVTSASSGQETESAEETTEVVEEKAETETEEVKTEQVPSADEEQKKADDK
ncbi:transcription termination/antitermination protein NusA [Candidatus Wolfebacteria bacterium]|nr:MAG: transcription termination/antitermination protein NusA [Candidatus Wolfebacteria bacterium]